MRRGAARGACPFLLLLLAPSAAAAADGDPAPSPPPLVLGGLSWVFSKDIDLLGQMHLELPGPASASVESYFTVEALTSLSRSVSGLTFAVRDLVYDVEAGARLRRASGRRLSFVVAQTGRERVDSPGQGYVRWAGVGYESEGFRDGRPPRGVVWGFAAGPTWSEREVDAVAFARGALRCTMPEGRVALGFDLFVDGLVEARAFRGDVAAGPRIDFPWAGDRRASLYVRYLRNRNPLGLELDAWTAGFELAEGEPPEANRPSPPDLDGILAAGSGNDGRLAGRFRIRAASPPFGGGFFVLLDVDANIVTAEDTGDLFYRYDVGLEHPWRDRRVGIWFYHRSNHQLAEENPEITSLDVVEAGIETPAWDRPPDLYGTRRLRWLDYRVRIGWLIDSAFGETTPVHGRGGVRAWLPPGDKSAVPFVSVEVEAGDVTAWAAALGVLLPHGLDVHLEYRDDDQMFSADRSLGLVVLAARF